MRRVFDFGVEEAAFTAHDGAVAEVAGEAVAIEGGGHGEEAEIGTRSSLQPEEQRKGSVSVEMAFVKLVEDDGGDAAE